MSEVKLVKKDEDKSRGIAGPAALSEGDEDPAAATIPPFLVLSLTFIAIGVLLALYGIHSCTKRKRMDRLEKALNDKKKEKAESSASSSDTERYFDEGIPVDSIPDDSLKMSESSSFVPPTISNIGNKRTSLANVHKCQNFPCNVCRRKQDIVFVKAPRVTAERGEDGKIEFVPVPVNYVGPNLTQELKPTETLSVSVDDGSGSSGESGESEFTHSDSATDDSEGSKSDSEAKSAEEKSHSMLLSDDVVIAPGV